MGKRRKQDPLFVPVLSGEQHRTLNAWMARPYVIRLIPLLPEEGGGWVADIPQLGSSTYTGTGETPTLALRSLGDVQRAYFARLLWEGEEPAQPVREDWSYVAKKSARLRRVETQVAGVEHSLLELGKRVEGLAAEVELLQGNRQELSGGPARIRLPDSGLG